jgi:hypothetical protein
MVKGFSCWFSMFVGMGLSMDRVSRLTWVNIHDEFKC